LIPLKKGEFKHETFITFAATTIILTIATLVGCGELWEGNDLNIEVLVTGLKLPEGIALDVAGGKMYWIAPGKIQWANLDGSNVETLITDLALPRDIALDVADGKMYLVTSQFWRANLDGSNFQKHYMEESVVPMSIALDVAGGKMYWTNTNAGKIQRANLGGSHIEDLFYIDTNPPSWSGAGLVDIALDVTDGKMYWVETMYQRESGERFYSIKSRIRRSNLDGSKVQTLVQTPVAGGLEEILALALDVMGGKMYWVEHFESAASHKQGQIRRSNLDGSNVEDLVLFGDTEDPVAILDIALDVTGGKIYWTEKRFGETLDGINFIGQIRRSNLD
jgi:DNA-binding beta-propeller fold protein YncE